MKKTIAQQLGVTQFPFEIRNGGNLIYKEWEDGFWTRMEYNSQGKLIFFEDSTDFWSKFKYNSEGREIFYENSKGEIIDNRPQPKAEPMTIEIDGKKYKLIEI